MKRESILKFLMVLSVLGFFVSVYLIENHYAPPVAGSFCDFSESVSCSLVNTSVYSELLNVPVALLGAIWFIFLGLMSWKAMGKQEYVPGLVIWNIFGLLFIIYFIIAEILLQAICPFCTVVHVIVLITLILSIILFKQLPKRQRKFNITKLIKVFRSFMIWIVILNLIPLIVSNWPGEKEDHTTLAKCLTEKEVNMYGSYRCGVCAKTKSMFGDAFEYVNEIECHPQGPDTQWELCQTKDLAGTPTWIMEPNGLEVKRHSGFLSTDELKEFSGCQGE